MYIETKYRLCCKNRKYSIHICCHHLMLDSCFSGRNLRQLGTKIINFLNQFDFLHHETYNHCLIQLRTHLLCGLQSQPYTGSGCLYFCNSSPFTNLITLSKNKIHFMEIFYQIISFKCCEIKQRDLHTVILKK